MFCHSRIRTSQVLRESHLFFVVLFASLWVVTGLTSRQVRGDDLANSKSTQAGGEKRLSILFLGDNGHHRPADRFAQLEPVLHERGIDMKYTDDVAKGLNAEMLAKFDGVVLYANIDGIEKPQADALLKFVADGKGFIPLHCATFCFRNDERIVALMGGQFQRHGGEVFSTVVADPKHPIMQGYQGFESWDETYVHTKHNEKGRTVLEYRVQGTQAEGQEREPWTWVRTEGKGRVFYTAWGHDQRTWSNGGFQNLVERGIRWACHDDPSKAGVYSDPNRFDVPQMTKIPADLKPFDYIDVGAKIPHYVAGAKWGIQEAPLTLMQKPLPAEESLKHFSVPEGFRVQIFATENSVTPTDNAPSKPIDRIEGPPRYAHLGGKPIAMNWDERGRLWVCETLDYPNELQPGNKGRDRIRICEDTDGDGQADKFTLFAEGLSIPTAILPIFGGVLVQNGTETLFLKDTDGDDRADVRQVLISNWTLGDTHGGVSNFRYGLDNWVYAMQGYNNSQPVITGTDEKGPQFRQGFWRMKLAKPVVGNAEFPHVPVVVEIEFLRSTNNNTWGFGLSEEGIIFGSTANHNPSVYMPIPNRYYEKVRGWGAEGLGTIADTHLFKPITDKVRQVDQFGGYTAGAGHALYTARTYPQQYWNRTAFVCGPTGHLVGTFVLKPDGADFHSTSPCNLIASDDEWSAPIMAEVGPDGNVWVLDWYNYIIQHNPTPQGFQNGKGNAYESDLRDKKHGRIYRITHSNNQLSPKPIDRVDGTTTDVATQPLATHIQNLANPTMLVRLNAQRMIVEQASLADVAAPLVALIEDKSIDTVGLNAPAIHALWTLHQLGGISPEHANIWAAVTSAATHPSAGVRRNVSLVLPRTNDGLKLLLDSSLLYDADPQVRLAAVLSLADMPESETAGHFARGLVQDEMNVMRDRWLSDAATSAAASHALPFLNAIVHAHNAPCGPATSNTSSEWKVVRRVAEHIARGKPDAETTNRLIALMSKGSNLFATATLEGLSDGWQKGHQVALTPESEKGLIAILEKLPAGAKGQLIQLASVWGSQELQKHTTAIVDALLSSIANDKSKLNERLSAAAQLIGFRPSDDAVVTQLLNHVTPQAAPELSAGLLEALSGSTAKNVGPELLDRIGNYSPALKETALRLLLSRPETTVVLLDGVDQGLVQLADLKLDQKMALSNHPNESIRNRAKKLLAMGGGLPDPDRQKVVEEYVAITKEKGDIDLGREVFKKNCSKCHRHGDMGENIGPNLTGMAVHPKAELLVHILDPSRSVEGNFRAYTIVTSEGRIFTGMLTSETRTSVELLDAEAKKHSLQRQDIEQFIASTKSVMPEGFEKTITKPEFIHLLEFLTHKGKYLPLDIRKVATSISTKSMFVSETNDAEKLIFPDWNPKTFKDVPFLLVDPKVDTVPNAILLYGPNGKFPPQMPKEVSLPVNAPAKSVHFLSGVSGWGHPYSEKGSVSLIVRLEYADGTKEDHELRNGVHFADYIRRVDVPESQFAFALRGQQIRYLTITPKRPTEPIKTLHLIKGPDATAPVVMAITVEGE
ncbi:MAG: ThuA domain-containing protein [Planctomycetaceae bacterium]